MDKERWGRIQEVFAEAVERAESERANFLDSVCGDYTAQPHGGAAQA